MLQTTKWHRSINGKLGRQDRSLRQRECPDPLLHFEGYIPHAGVSTVVVRSHFRSSSCWETASQQSLLWAIVIFAKPLLFVLHYTHITGQMTLKPLCLCEHVARITNDLILGRFVVTNWVPCGIPKERYAFVLLFRPGKKRTKFGSRFDMK